MNTSIFNPYEGKRTIYLLLSFKQGAYHSPMHNILSFFLITFITLNCAKCSNNCSSGSSKDSAQYTSFYYACFFYGLTNHDMLVAH